ncbi:MAG: hypothetical protein ACREFE_01295 [Limisphaerales bacterium]
MEAESLFAPVHFAEIRLNGKTFQVPSLEIEGRTLIVTGKWIKTASIRDADVMEGELVKNPETFIAALKNGDLKADVLTFFQRPPEVTPKFNYHFEWENYAAVPITTFENWWEKLPQETRKNARRAAKRGVVMKSVAFDDELARGIHKLYNETPVRQGKRFWHYGKNFETVKREHVTYLERSEFIGAYFQDELIGFIKMVYVDRLAYMFHIIAMNAHFDKRPMNALIAKAIEVCAQKGVGYLIYGNYIYGNKNHSSLAEFKRRNGFEPINFPTYYIPLTLKGALYINLKLYRGAGGLLPEPVLQSLLAIRSWFYNKREKSAESNGE